MRRCISGFASMILAAAMVGPPATAQISTSDRAKQERHYGARATRPGVQAPAPTVASRSAQPRIKILDIRRWSGPWAAVIRTPDGEYATVSAEGRKAGLPALPATPADGWGFGASSASTDFSSLDAYPALTAAILLVSVEETVAKKSVFFEALRKLETDTGHRFNQVAFEVPNPPAQGSWGQIDGSKRGQDAAELVLSFITSLTELAAGLESADPSQRRQAYAAFRRLRSSLANPYLIRGASDGDPEVRSGSLRELEDRGAESIPALRVAARDDSDHNSALRDLLLRLEYRAAVQANDPKAHAEFLKRYPDSRYDAEMRYRLLSAKNDIDGLRRLTATFAGKGQVQDIVEALNAGLIEATSSGGNITTVYVRVRRTVPHPITIRVPTGSYFVAGNPAAQNMVTTAQALLELVTDEWQSVDVQAACANILKDIPDSRVRFSVSKAPPQSELLRLVQHLETSKAKSTVRQAAVWIVTDNATLADLTSKLLNRNLRTGATTRAITDDDIAMALRIAQKAGIDLASKAIWADRAAVYQGVDDAGLKKWLRSQP